MYHEEVWDCTGPKKKWNSEQQLNTCNAHVTGTYIYEGVLNFYRMYWTQKKWYAVFNILHVKPATFR
jgi:hypothetical protein